MRYRYYLLLIAAAFLCGAGPTGPLGGRLAPRNYNNPQLYPSVNGPGPGVIAARGGGPRDRVGSATAQILFQGPDGMNVNWDVAAIGSFDSQPIVTEGVQDFETGKEYRLRLSNLPNRKGIGGAPLNLYPTLQVNSVTPRTRSYLEHNAIPVRITDNDIDQVQADAILSMQLVRLANMEAQKIVDEHNELMRRIADYNDILARPERQRTIVGEELDEIVAKYGDERRTKILPFSGEMNVEDLIPEENVVVTVTHSGFIKRTKADEYRAQHRGGKGIKGAKLREDDVVDHFFLTSTHNWLLFFTNKGRVYRLKAYELPEGSRDSKGQHVANLLQFAPDESIQTVLSIPNYEVAKYLVLATRSGKVKKTALAEYDSPRQGGLIAVRLMVDENGENADELIGAALCNADDDIMLVSRNGMSLKFTADDEQLRPMGRQTAGVQGMKFRDGDELLAMDVVWGDTDKDLLVVTNEGFAKRSAVSEYRLQGRNGYGVKALQLAEGRGSLVGALIVSEDDQVMAIMKSGKVIRSDVAEVKRTGRNTQGVTLAKPDKNDEIISIALNAERDEDEDDDLGVNAESGNTEQQPVEQSAEQPADEQNVNTEVDGE